MTYSKRAYGSCRKRLHQSRAWFPAAPRSPGHASSTWSCFTLRRRAACSSSSALPCSTVYTARAPVQCTTSTCGRDTYMRVHPARPRYGLLRYYTCIAGLKELWLRAQTPCYLLLCARNRPRELAGETAVALRAACLLPCPCCQVVPVVLWCCRSSNPQLLSSLVADNMKCIVPSRPVAPNKVG